MKSITVKVNKKTGEVTTETSGFTGESCMEATRQMQAKFAGGDVQHKPEFYEQETQVDAEYLCG